MERFNKIILLLTLLIGIFLLTGCDKLKFNASHDDSIAGVTVIPADSQSSKAATDSKSGDDQTKQQETQKVTPTQALSDVELQIYTVSEDGAVEPVTVLIPDNNITPELVVDKVKESLSDQGYEVDTDSITTDKDAVIVSFKKNATPSTLKGSDELEANILNAFAQSLIDNLKDYNKVIFRIEGKAYTSGVFEFGINEPYMKK